MLNTFFGYLFGLGLLTIALYLFVFAILEKKWAAEPGQPLSAYFLNIRITILYAIASSFFSGVSAGAIAKAGTSLGLGLIDLRFYPGNTILQVIVGIFIVAITDFFYYWFHRLQHMIPALWAQHKVHHLDEYLNADSIIDLNSFIFKYLEYSRIFEQFIASEYRSIKNINSTSYLLKFISLKEK